jgi:hypothetical protein
VDRGAVSGQGARQPLRVGRGSGPRPRHGRDHLSEASRAPTSLGVKPARRRRLWIVAGALPLLTMGIGYVLAIRRRASMPRSTRRSRSAGRDRRRAVHARRVGVVYGATWEGKPLELYSIRLGNFESVPLGLPPAHLLSVARDGSMAILMEPLTGASSTSERWRALPLGGRHLACYRSPCRTPAGVERPTAVLRWTEDESKQVLEYPPGRHL